MRYHYLQAVAPDSKGRSFWDPDHPTTTVYVNVFSEDFPRDGHPVTRILETLWKRHNVDGRPRGPEIRSMSIGDVLVLIEEGADPAVYRCVRVGWEPLQDEDLVEPLVSVAERGLGAHTVIVPEGAGRSW